MKKALFIVFGVLFLDQVLKIWIKTHMMLGQEFHIFGDWFIIHFTENNGMAFGMEFAGQYGKLLLTLFRIVAIGGIIWYLYSLIKDRVKTGLVIAISLILSGAIGNLLDCLFYGVIFNDSYFQLATLFPAGGGYSKFLHGSVVDMLYFPILHGTFPSWFPFWSGEEFEFFRPVFNIADTSISVGVCMLLVFQKRYFKDGKPILMMEQVEEFELPQKSNK